MTHSGKRPEADRAYIATWALASYLMFDRRVLGSSALDEFVKNVSAGGEPMVDIHGLWSAFDTPERRIVIHRNLDLAVQRGEVDMIITPTFAVPSPRGNNQP